MKYNRVRQSARRRNQKGHAMMEAALTSTLFFTLLIGTFDFGQFLFLHQAMVERVRSAARWGAVAGNGSDLTGTKNMVLYNQPTVPTGKPGYFGLTDAMVNVTATDLNTDDARLTVRVNQYPFSMLSPFLAGAYQGRPIQVSVPLGMLN